LVNFNAPDGSAAIDTELLAPLDNGAADVADALDVAGELVAVLLADELAAALLLPPLEPPQAPMPSARAIATIMNLGVLRTRHISLLFVRLNSMTPRCGGTFPSAVVPQTTTRREQITAGGHPSERSVPAYRSACVLIVGRPGPRQPTSSNSASSTSATSAL
jgi:hypothetical protein